MKDKFTFEELLCYMAIAIPVYCVAQALYEKWCLVRGSGKLQ